MYKRTCEIVQVQLANSFPLLTYLVAALDISQSKVCELGVCWNDAFRRIFGLNRWESLKLIQYFCGALDFKHYCLCQMLATTSVNTCMSLSLTLYVCTVKHFFLSQCKR